MAFVQGAHRRDKAQTALRRAGVVRDLLHPFNCVDCFHQVQERHAAKLLEVRELAPAFSWARLASPDLIAPGLKS